MVAEHVCAERACVRLRRLVARLLDSSVRSPEHFEIRARLADLGQRQGWYDAEGLPPEALDDVAADVLDHHHAPAEPAAEALVDWRDEATRAAHRQLVGAWWCCVVHGPTQSPTYLADVAYCPADDCTRFVLDLRSGT